MFDIKFIKDNSDFFDNKLKKRNLPPLSAEILEIYDAYLKVLNDTQDLQEKKNILSKKFSPNLNPKELNFIKSEVSDIKKKLEYLKKDSEKKKVST